MELVFRNLGHFPDVFLPKGLVRPATTVSQNKAPLCSNHSFVVNLGLLHLWKFKLASDKLQHKYIRRSCTIWFNFSLILQEPLKFIIYTETYMCTYNFSTLYRDSSLRKHVSRFTHRSPTADPGKNENKRSYLELVIINSIKNNCFLRIAH